MDDLSRYITGLRAVLDSLPLNRAAQVVDILALARLQSRQVFLIGNGGSAATASHFACDLGKGTAVPGQRRFRAIALTDSMPLLSAWANDAAYEHVFAEQLDNLLNPHDVVIAISCSGSSPNVLSAMRLARRRGAVTVGFTGAAGAALAALCDVTITVPSEASQPVEDAHLVLEHAICGQLRHQAEAEPSTVAARAAATSAPRGSRTTAIFLDRDGVINENRRDHVLCWDDFSFLPGVFEALWDLSRDGQKVIVVSNQAAIARGLVTQAEVEAINDRMLDELGRRGARIDAVYVCPHHPDAGCDCRKPKPGLLLQAARNFDLDLSDSFVVGDSASDVLAAKAVGARPMLVLSGKGPDEAALLRDQGVEGHHVVPDLRSAAALIQGWK